MHPFTNRRSLVLATAFTMLGVVGAPALGIDSGPKCRPEARPSASAFPGVIGAYPFVGPSGDTVGPDDAPERPAPSRSVSQHIVTFHSIELLIRPAFAGFGIPSPMSPGEGYTIRRGDGPSPSRQSAAVAVRVEDIRPEAIPLGPMALPPLNAPRH